MIFQDQKWGEGFDDETKVLIQGEYYPGMILRINHQGQSVIWEVFPVVFLTYRTPAYKNVIRQLPRMKFQVLTVFFYGHVCIC